MMDFKYSLLAISSSTNDSLLESEAVKSLFDVHRAATRSSFLVQLAKNPDVNLLLLDFDSIQQNYSGFIEEVFQLAAADSSNPFDDKATVPLIVIGSSIPSSIQKDLFEKGVWNIIDYASGEEIIIPRMKLLASRIEALKNNSRFIEKRHKTEMRWLIQIDQRTGIYNKQTFIEQTLNLIKKNPEKNFLIVHMDLDRFRIFNDIYGFEAGNKLLRYIGDIFLALEGQTFTYGYLYADHFVLCVDERRFNPLSVEIQGREKLEAFGKHFEFVIRSGIYKLPKNETDIDLACDRAFLALKSIKSSYTDHYAYYDESMMNKIKEEQEFTTDIVQAFEKEEFCVYFQPQYDYATESLSGAEALVRWNHSTKGMISPGVFIPLLERNGLVTRLDMFVWDKTCSLLKSWIDKGLGVVPISVNISRRDIYGTNLPDIFSGLLQKYGLTTEFLRLEITESAYMDNPSQLIKVVTDLQNLGFKVEMDDFGSGYSSLNTLKDVPVDVLKLDMKFIMDGVTGTACEVTSKSRGGNILSSVVRMANWLHLPVIAEGIESKAQADYLKSIGCFNMQGFYFARPMPVEEFEELLMTVKPVYDRNKFAANGNFNTKKPVINEIDKIDFFDVSIQQQLLFNDFVGGAAIIEWKGNSVEAIKINDRYFEELGTTRSDYMNLQKNILDRLEEKSRPVFLSTLAEVTTSGKDSFCEVQCLPIYLNTDPFWVRVHLRHLGNSKANDLYFLSIDNIDFRMQLLQLNTNLSEQLANIMESASCGIITLDFKNYIEKFLVSYCNETAARMLGYNQSEFRMNLSADLFSVFAEGERDIFEKYLFGVVKERKSVFSSKTKLLCKNGEEKNVIVSGKLLEKSDSALSVCLSVIDIDTQERLNIIRYTNLLFALFNEVYEIDFGQDTSRIIKSEAMKDCIDVIHPLRKTLEYWGSNFVVPEDQKVFYEMLDEKVLATFQEKKNFPMKDFRIQLKNGEEKLVRALVLPLGGNTYMLSLKDITGDKA